MKLVKISAICSGLSLSLAASIVLSAAPPAQGFADPFHCFEDDGVLDTQLISADECFGRAVEGIGDLDGDGTFDLTSGAGNEGGPDGPGGVHIFFLNGCPPSIVEQPQSIVVDAG